MRDAADELERTQWRLASADAEIAELRSQLDEANWTITKLDSAVQNLIDGLDSPINRRKFGEDGFLAEAIKIGRAAISKGGEQ
jgi:chromosome segregation ATPase